ncbi:hypothetical protein [uncultured Friedmanniella sp.]|uniref:hypothetical protein n=1 Tax=uncultured Friedmanniella sp. TaxID=335381 RepID=UPI0035CA08FB
MTDIITTRLTTTDGAKLVFCDQLCCDRWLLSNVSHVQPRVADGPRRIVGSCCHCAWDGELVAAPADGDCRWHQPNSCEAFEPLASYHVAYAARQLRELVGGPLSPRCYRYLTDHARALRDCGRLDARALVEFAQGVRIDWDSSW